jgi:hypothetical protein
MKQKESKMDKKMVSDCCGAEIIEHLDKGHYAYAPYTNWLECSKCHKPCQPREEGEDEG